MPTRDRILAVLCEHEAGRIRFTFPSRGGNLRINYAVFLRVAQAIGCSHVHVSVTNTLPPGFGKSLKFRGPFSHEFVRATEHGTERTRSMYDNQPTRRDLLKKGPPAAPTLYRSYDVTPTPGKAPLRLGTRDLDRFLRGGLDEAAVYPRCLTADEIRKNYRTAGGAGGK